MTVKELRELLKDLPDQSTVVVSTDAAVLLCSGVTVLDGSAIASDDSLTLVAINAEPQ